MTLGKSFPYTVSLRIHTLIGGALGVFILFILFFLESHNSGSFHFPYKSLYLLGYGMITCLTYVALYLLSTFVYIKNDLWRVFDEILFCCVFIVISILVAFFYTELIINNNPDRVNLAHFINWFQVVFLGYGPLLFIATILLRKTYTQLDASYKKEFLQVNESDLIYVKSESNYVRIFYFEDNIQKEKLLRSTLTNIKKTASCIYSNTSFIYCEPILYSFIKRK